MKITWVSCFCNWFVQCAYLLNLSLICNWYLMYYNWLLFFSPLFLWVLKLSFNYSAVKYLSFTLIFLLHIYIYIYICVCIYMYRSVGYILKLEGPAAPHDLGLLCISLNTECAIYLILMWFLMLCLHK